MSNPGETDATPIATQAQLAEHIAAGCKPRAAWRIGTEHEKFGFRRTDHAPPPYEPAGIHAILQGLATDAWSPIEDAGHLIGLTRDGASVSLEPAGQLELSGAPVASLHDTQAELAAHLHALRQVAAPLGLGFAPLGFHPTATRAQMPWMPKSRYTIMRDYMRKTGSRGLDMMLRTCTVQVNLDYASEADMAAKFRASLLLQPVATALFANSPFAEGRPTGMLSGRAHVWLDTDARRTGIPPVAFEDGFGFERYVDWLLDVPMYFVMRDGAFRDVAGRSFRRFMAGTEPALADTQATVGDFADHMTTAFTDVRLKRFLEMRGSDAGSPAMMLAQSALWVGLLYDDAALAAAAALLARHPWRDLAALRDAVPFTGLQTPWQSGTLRDLARDMVAIAHDGLRARGLGEEPLLDPLRAIVEDGAPTQAEHWLQRYHGAWGGDVTRIFAEAAV